MILSVKLAKFLNVNEGDMIEVIDSDDISHKFKVCGLSEPQDANETEAINAKANKIFFFFISMPPTLL